MSVEKVFKCDLCEQHREREQLIRFGVRLMDDRPEDADNVDVCLSCRERPVMDAVLAAQDMRRLVTHGE
jgi:hypothetical protein